MLSGKVTGRAELARVETAIRGAPVTLHKQLEVGVRAALKPLKPDIVQETRTLPGRGGYQAVAARAVQVNTRVTSTGARITADVKVFAQGKQELRDLAAVNRGRLRHPRWGDRAHWYTTTVRPGFVDRPVDRVRDRVVDNSRAAANAYANQIVKG